MVTLRRAHVAYVLTLACSSASLSTDTTGLEGVDALEDLECHGQCAEENISGAALSQGAMWLTRTKVLMDCSSTQCTAQEQEAAIARASFGADGGLEVLGRTPTYTGATNSMTSGVDVGSDGTIYLAHTDPTAAVIVFDSLTADGADAGSATQKQFGAIIGVAADTRAAIVGVANVSPNQGQGSVDTSVDQGTNQIRPASNLSDGGTLYRVNFADGGVSTLPSGVFATSLSLHLFAADATNVYWVTPGTVMSAPRDLSKSSALGSFPNGSNMCVSNACDITGAVGLGVANGVVAVAVLRGTATSVCGSGPCTSTFASSGCQIVKMPSTVIYDDPSTSCMGLAIDGTDAYFGIIEENTTLGCCGPDGGPQPTTTLRTTGIGRVPLVGSSSKPAATFQIGETQRLYGPRRFFADDTFVYGIDPAYALRVAKTAFK